MYPLPRPSNEIRSIMPVPNCSYDVIIIIEPLLTADINDAEFSHTACNTYAQGRTSHSSTLSRGRDVLIDVNEKFCLGIINSNPSIEQLFLHLEYTNHIRTTSTKIVWDFCSCGIQLKYALSKPCQECAFYILFECKKSEKP